MVIGGKEIKKWDIFSPFYERTEIVRPDGSKLTFGVGPAGYDVRVEFDSTGKVPEVTLEPGGFMLAATKEHFLMPSRLIAFVHDKSSWARRGLAVQNTVIEPGWHGYLTLELTNHSQYPIRIFNGDPIAQIIFHRIEGDTIPYSGKYQSQARGPVEAI